MTPVRAAPGCYPSGMEPSLTFTAAHSCKPLTAAHYNSRHLCQDLSRTHQTEMLTHIHCVPIGAVLPAAVGTLSSTCLRRCQCLVAVASTAWLNSLVPLQCLGVTWTGIAAVLVDRPPVLVTVLRCWLCMFASPLIQSCVVSLRSLAQAETCSSASLGCFDRSRYSSRPFQCLHV